MDKIAYPTTEVRRAEGLAARERAPLSSHTKWSPAADRPDPVALLEESGKDRVPELLPIRYGRMLPSPFAFLSEHLGPVAP